MSAVTKKLSLTLLAFAVILGITLPALSYADTTTDTASQDAATEANLEPSSAEEAVEATLQNAALDAAEAANTAEIFTGANNQSDEAVAGEASSSTTSGNTNTDGQAAESQPATDCVVTLEYWENMNYEDEDNPANDEGRRLLGTYQLTGLTEGQIINTWDYVVDIPGHFFWDAWPARLVVSSNPDDNVIKLFYFKLWNAEYTVNYYLMANADLSADNWSEALAPDDVEFIKMGSETFTNQRFDQLVKGDAYEYKIDGTYVVDTYPAEIRLGVDNDDNVINVLYVPDSANLPDGAPGPGDNELKPDPSEPTTPPDNGNGGTTTPPDNEGTIPPDDPTGGVTTPGDGTTPDLPGDTEFDKDDFESVLPPDDEVIDDFINSGDADDTIEITDEMIENPVPPSEAEYVRNVYETGLRQGETLAQTGDTTAMAIVGTVAALAAVAAIVAFVAWRRSQKKEASEA